MYQWPWTKDSQKKIINYLLEFLKLNKNLESKIQGEGSNLKNMKKLIFAIQDVNAHF